MSDGISTFKSYTHQAEQESLKQKKLSIAYQKVYERPPDDEVNQLLLPGEIAVSHAKKVIKYNINDDPTKGACGTLICTNFRLAFITSELSAYGVNQLQNHLIGGQDIPLNSIDSIYVEYPTKRKRLYPGSNVKEGIRRLEIHCKSFRVAAFNFKLTVKHEEEWVIKAILHHAYPATVSLLFAFDYRHGLDVRTVDDTTKVATYRTYKDWHSWLRLHNLEAHWRVSSVNQSYTVSETMGEHFIVPISSTDSSLEKAANQFNNNRLPVWCWASRNGCSLIRSAELRGETERGEVEKELYTMIQKSDPQWRSIKTFEIGKICPKCLQIQNSFFKLKNICCPSSEEEFYEKDSTWLSSLHATKWLHHVSTCLTVACDVIEWMVNKDHNVIVKEPSGVDLSPVITSLVQLMADPTSRTLVGFQSLIQREWVIGGFPFLDRLGHISQPSKSKPNNAKSSEGEPSPGMSPVFLLFLDCVWQLLRQFPSSFEFTSTFLTCLHDGSRMLIFDTFLFNNERQRNRWVHQCEQKQTNQTWEPLPIWAWPLQYNDESIKLFNNPLYKLSGSWLVGGNLPPTPPIVKKQSRSFSIPLSISLSTDSLDAIDETNSSPIDEDTPSPLTEATPSDLASSGSSELQVHYSKQLGVLVRVGTEDTNEGEKKKKNRFSFRRKKSAGNVLADLELASSSNEVPVEFVTAFMVELSRVRRRIAVEGDVLRPRCIVHGLVFWDSCHLRWGGWSQIFGGGPMSVFQQEAMLCDEIYFLKDKVLRLERELDDVTSNGLNDVGSDDSGMFFCHRSEAVPHPSGGDGASPEDPPELISNYYPYSPVKDMPRSNILGPPMSSAFRGGSLFNLPKIRGRHSRTSSDISLTTRAGEELPVRSNTGGAHTSSTSLDSLDEVKLTKTSTKVPPQFTKPPPKVLPKSQKPPPKVLPKSQKPPSKLSPKPEKSNVSPKPLKSPPKLPPQAQKPQPPKKALMPPDKPLTPPKERITYVSSV